MAMQKHFWYLMFPPSAGFLEHKEEPPLLEWESTVLGNICNVGMYGRSSRPLSQHLGGRDGKRRQG